MARPSHWIKNVFVLAGVFFAEDWTRSRICCCWPPPPSSPSAWRPAPSIASTTPWTRTRIAPIPRKRLRPVAAGTVSPQAAYALAAALGAAALALSLYAGPRLSACLAAYGAVNILYSRALKRVVLVDVFCIASGFILRLLAGTWGIGVEPSQWFLLCTFNLSLFLGFSKRYAERSDGERSLEDKRAVMKSYSPEFLRMLMTVTLSATLIMLRAVYHQRAHRWKRMARARA